MADYKLNYTGDQVSSGIDNAINILNKVYPVGSIYMSVNSANPSSFIGGTWERIQDSFLLAAGSSYAAGATGGEASHTLTTSEMPQHGHRVHIWDNAGTMANAWFYNQSGVKTTHSGARLYNASSGTWIASGATANAAASGQGDPSGGTTLSGGGQHIIICHHTSRYTFGRGPHNSVRRCA